MALLTIAIPTYNRYEQIQIQVRRLLPQLNEHVELIVYDNCSPTPIQTLFNTEELSKFTLIRNSANVGADANIARCFENCTTKWLWTLSDDDYIKTNALTTLLKYINKNPENVFTCAWGRGNIELSKSDQFFKSLDTLETFSGAFTMSYCIYNIDKVKPYLVHYYANITSMHGPLIMTIKYAEQNPNAKYAFANINIIDQCATEVGWNYIKFIRQSELILHALDPCKRKYYNKTVFKGYFRTNYFLIQLNRQSTNVSRINRLKLLTKTIRKQGIINALIYDGKMITRLYAKLLIKFW